MKILLTFISLTLTLSIFSQHEKKLIIHPFETDGCTGWLNSFDQYDWSRCCVIHDLYFWAGGTTVHRDLADKRLQSCVEEKTNRLHANLIYFAVRTGALFPLKIKSKKWGNAWPPLFQNELLNVDDIKKIETSLQNLADSKNLSLAEINEFLSIITKLNLK